MSGRKSELSSRIAAFFLALAVIFGIGNYDLPDANAASNIKFVPIAVNGSASAKITVTLESAENYSETSFTWDVDSVNLVGNLPNGEYGVTLGGNFFTFNGIIIDDSTDYVPLFLHSGSSGQFCLALYAEVDTVAELDVLGGSNVRIADSGTNVPTTGRINGDKLTLHAGELAVITGLDGSNFTLNGVPSTVNSGGKFIVLSTAGNSSSGTSGVGARDLLKIALDNAEKFANRESDYTAETWMIFTASFEIASDVYADSGASEQQVSVAANNLFAALDGLTQIYNAPTGRVPLEITGKAEFALTKTGDTTVSGETLVLEITAADAAYLSAAVVEFAYSGAMTFEYAGGSAGFVAIAVNSAPGRGSVALLNNNFARSNANSFSQTEPDTVIARLRFRSTAPGNASAELSSVLATAVDGEGIGTDVTADFSGAIVSFSVVEGTAAPDLPLDFNGDFNVSLADLATVQAYYRCSASSDLALWNSKAKYADYDDDGVITIDDYLLILPRIYEWTE
jgi:hypothetical protein